MPTAASAGFSGKVYVSIDAGTTYIPVGETTSAALTTNREAIDATSFDSVGWMENIPGLGSWELSIECLYINQSFAGNIGQVNVQNSIFGGQVVRWKLLPKVGVGNIGYVGDGLVTSFEPTLDVSSAVTLAVSITGSGYLDTYQAV